MAHQHNERDGAHRWSISPRWILLGFLAVAGFFFFSEHRAHLFGYLPFVLLLLCPLMHLFHGHGDHRGAAPDERGTQRREERQS